MRVNCPDCNGKNTLSVSKTATEYVWHCFRASCKSRGHEKFLSDKLGLQSVLCSLRRTNKTFSNAKIEDVSIRTDFKAPDRFTSIFSNGKAIDWCVRWGLIEGIETGLLSLRWDPLYSRVVFLSYSMDGQLIDAVGRSLLPKVKPKWYRYGDSHAGFLILPKEVACVALPLVLVEDVISAYFVAQTGLRSMALLGTNITSDMKNTLIGQCVILALDADASRKAMKMTPMLRLYAKQVSTVFLTEDLKYCSKEETRKILGFSGLETQ